MVEDSGEITVQALARSNSAAASMVRKAVSREGLLRVLRADGVQGPQRVSVEAAMRSSLMEAPITTSGVPSVDPPSALRMTARSRGKRS